MRPPSASDWWWDDFLQTWAVIASGCGITMLLIEIGSNEHGERQAAADSLARSLLLGLRTAAKP